MKYITYLTGYWKSGEGWVLHRNGRDFGIMGFGGNIAILAILGCFPLTSPRRQTRQRLFTLPILPAGDVLSINGNSGNAGDTGFAG